MKRLFLFLILVTNAYGAPFVFDTFTGTDLTDLTAHTGETGATWAKVTGITGVFLITSNTAKGNSGGLSEYYASGTPAGAEYDVEADFHMISSNDYPGVGGRIDTAADSGYYLELDNDAAHWDLVQRVAGTDTVLGQYSDTPANGDNRHLKLQIRNATKKAFIDSVERISSTDNTITGAGKSGMRTINSDWGVGTTGRTLDNFTATDAVVVSSPYVLNGKWFFFP